MKIWIVVAAAVVSGAVLAAQDEKPVPKNSERVFVTGCTKGYVFTAGLPAADRGSSAVPVGTHLRMAGPKNLIKEIESQEGNRVELTGLVKKGQFSTGGVQLGGGVSMRQPSGSSGGLGPSAAVSQIVVDVEGWRRVAGECPR